MPAPEARPKISTTDGKSRGVAILGPGRSGTSAVTRMFVSAGFFAGHDADLMEATDANPTGHWENLKVFRINEEILSRLGGNWLDPPSEAEQIRARAWAIQELRTALDELFDHAGGAPVAIKDPRIGMLLPIWGEFLDDQLHPVLVVRNPIEIAQSMSARDGTPTSSTMAIWQLQISNVLRHLHGRQVTIAPYGSLLGSDRAAGLVLGSALGHLNVHLAARITGKPTPPDSGLHHNQAYAADYDQQLSIRQYALWQELEALPAGEHRLDMPQGLLDCAPAVLDLARAETERHAAWRREEAAQRAAVEERERNEILTQQLAEERTRLGAELDAERTEHQAAAEELRLANGYLEAIQGSLSWRLTAPIRAAKRRLR
jgi:hypothetical protein